MSLSEVDEGSMSAGKNLASLPYIATLGLAYPLPPVRPGDAVPIPDEFKRTPSLLMPLVGVVVMARGSGDISES